MKRMHVRLLLVSGVLGLAGIGRRKLRRYLRPAVASGRFMTVDSLSAKPKSKKRLGFLELCHEGRRIYVASWCVTFRAIRRSVGNMFLTSTRGIIKRSDWISYAKSWT
jgi:hypothetical protein